MKRESYIDIAKGIGIIMVIFCHVIEICKISELTLIMRFCYAFHMPLFFFISGYCLGLKKEENSKHSLPEDLKKITVRLLLPYFIWSYVYMVIGGNLWNTERIYAVLTTRGIAPIWFLATLFICEILFLAVKKCTYSLKLKTSFAVFTILGSICLILGYTMHSIQNEWHLSSASIGTPLYYLFVATGRFFISMPMLIGGYLFSKSKIMLKHKKTTCFVAGSAMIFIVFCLVRFTKLITNIHLFETNHYFVLIFTAFVGTIGVLLISYSLPQKSAGILIAAGKNSLYLMLLHYVPFKTIRLSARLFQSIQNPFLFCLCTGITVTFMSALGAYLLKRVFFLEKKDNNS